MVSLITCVNGFIRNTNRVVQLHHVCVVLGIKTLLPLPLTSKNAWFAGMFDADGTITLNDSSCRSQITISVTAKLLIDVQPFLDVFGGYVYFDKAQNGYYK